MEELDEDLVSAVLASSRALLAIATLSMDASPIEVTLSQFRALVVLSSRGPQHMSGLARVMKLLPSSATRLVERLEKKGLVERHRSASSRREIELDLTPAGIDLVTAVMDARRIHVERVLREVPADRRAPLASAFQEFARAAGEPLDIRLAAAPHD